MAGAVLVDGIGVLVTNDPSRGDGSPLGMIRNAAMVVADGRVRWLSEAPASRGAGRGLPAADRRVDLNGRCVLPGFVDSHSHLVFAGDRVAEFTARMAGRPYTAGGIATTVAATRAATQQELTETVSRLVAEARRSGTTTMEIKSGYALTAQGEARSLAVAARFTEEATFLGAHVVPPEYANRRDDYVRLVCGDMLTACVPYARWIDVFCERGAFDADEAREILLAGRAAGLIPRVHGNQLGPGPGAQLAVEVDAASVDHCTYLSDDDVAALAGSRANAGSRTNAGSSTNGRSGTVATLLPGVEFSTRSPYPDARRLLDAGVTVALATDCNPGTSYTSSMPFCIALAVREMGMTPAEAVWAATAGGAAALRRADIGVLRPGARADLAVLDAPGPDHLAYRPGVAQVSAFDPAASTGCQP